LDAGISSTILVMLCRKNDREAEFQAKIAKIKAGAQPTF
jgi:hypothetical protein